MEVGPTRNQGSITTNTQQKYQRASGTPQFQQEQQALNSGIKNTDQLSKIYYDQLNKFLLMKFCPENSQTNNQLQNLQHVPQQEQDSVVDAMEQRDRALESNLAAVLLQLDQQKQALLQQIDKMRGQAVSQHTKSVKLQESVTKKPNQDGSNDVFLQQVCTNLSAQVQSSEMN